MNWNGISAPSLLMAILLALLSLPVPTAESALAPVDPTVWQTLEGSGQRSVLVILEEQADLGGALALQTKGEKGWYVYRELTTTAERTQASLRAYLDKLGIAYRPYWIRNLILLSTDDPALLRALSSRSEVDRIEAFVPDEPESILSSGHDSGRLSAIGWNLQRVRADDVWAMGFTGGGVVIGLIDSGVDWDHPGLINAYRPGFRALPLATTTTGTMVPAVPKFPATTLDTVRPWPGSLSVTMVWVTRLAWLRVHSGSAAP